VSWRVEQKDKDFSKLRHEIVDSGVLAGLSSAAIRVYLVILRYAHYETGLSYPTVEIISKLSGVNKNRIASATRELTLSGLIDKYRAGKKFGFRNCYRVIKHPKIAPDTIPENTDKCKHFLRGEDGRFTPVPENRENGIPQNRDDHIPLSMESDTYPQKKDKKENLEINNRDKDLERAGSASACSKSQAEPALNSKKSLKNISKETIDGFIKDKGLEWVKGYLRKMGYDQKEIESLSGVEGGEDERVNTAESD